MSLDASLFAPMPTWKTAEKSQIATAGLAALIAMAGSASLWFGLPDASFQIRVSLIVFGLAILGWTALRLPAMPVALAASLALVLFKVVPESVLYQSLGHELIWLLIAAFIIAAALRRSGVAERLILSALARVGSVGHLFYATALVISLTAFVIPSTSGRAALLLPIFLALSNTIDNNRITRALALLFPSVILLTACASIIGAGAHLIAIDLLRQSGLAPIGFLHWIVLGAPFAVLSAGFATLLILNLFLNPDERSRKLDLPSPDRGPLTDRERFVVTVMVFTVGLWATEALHGISLAIVGLVGALAATWTRFSGVTMKEAVKDTEWNLLIFLAATFVLGAALVESGAATFIAENAIAAISEWVTLTPLTLVGFAAIASMLAHLVVTSRTARVLVLVPAIAIPLSAFGVNPAALIFLVTIGSGFCQTLAVSAKPVALYRTLDCPTYDERDLLRLSLWLMPFMMGLLMLFSFFVWPILGLPLVS